MSNVLKKTLSSSVFAIAVLMGGAALPTVAAENGYSEPEYTTQGEFRCRYNSDGSWYCEIVVRF